MRFDIQDPDLDIIEKALKDIFSLTLKAWRLNDTAREKLQNFGRKHPEKKDYVNWADKELIKCAIAFKEITEHEPRAMAFVKEDLRKN